MASGLRRLDQGLYRLLHHRSVRQACHAGRWEVLALPESERTVLTALDMNQVEQLAAQIREDVLHRQHRGSGSLLTLFARTIAAWRAGHPKDVNLADLASQFMESDAYEAQKEFAPSPDALSLEESFFRFCESDRIGEPDVREDEFLTAMARALVVNSRPAFAVPTRFGGVRAGWFAVGSQSPPRLYAAVGGRLVVGEITPFLAELLQPGIDPSAVAHRHGADSALLRAAQTELSGLGLID